MARTKKTNSVAEPIKTKTRSKSTKKIKNEISDKVGIFEYVPPNQGGTKYTAQIVDGDKIEFKQVSCHGTVFGSSILSIIQVKALMAINYNCNELTFHGSNNITTFTFPRSMLIDVIDSSYN